MIPSTPIGVATRAMSRPFGIVQRASSRPTGSDSAATSATPFAVASTRFASSFSRSISAGLKFRDAADFMSSAFAARILNLVRADRIGCRDQRLVLRRGRRVAHARRRVARAAAEREHFRFQRQRVFGHHVHGESDSALFSARSSLWIISSRPR